MTPSGNGPDGGRRHLPPLLPANEALSTTSSALNPLSSPVSPSRRRITVPAACEPCRRRKAKCDAVRPKCSACSRLDADCSYSTERGETHAQALKRKYDELQTLEAPYKQLFDMLRSHAGRDSQDIVRMIQAGDNADTIIHRLNEADLLLQVSLVPETRLRFVFPYTPTMPPALVPGNRYLDSLLYEATSLSTVQDSRTGEEQALTATAFSASSEPGFGASRHLSPYLKPYHAAKLVEPRLDSVKPSEWTSVSSNDSFMRSLLEGYFFYEYSFSSFFQKDYFLEDMAKHEHHYCSSLLVNAILAYAWYCKPGIPNRFEYWNPHSLGYRFLAEAKRLWEIEAENGSNLTTIHAALHINAVMMMCGLDKPGWKYTTQAIDIAHKLGLFDTTQIKTGKLRNAMEFTAWALFSFQSLLAYHFQVPPLLEHPPKSNLPDPWDNPEWYGELWVTYPLDERPYQLYFPCFFRALCEFNVILNDICLHYFGKETMSTAGISFEQATPFFTRLKAWYELLPQSLIPERIVFFAQLKLHLQYNCVLIKLVAPFISTAVTTSEHNAQVINTEARKHFETIIRLYFLRHSFESVDFMIVYLVLLTTLSLREITGGQDESELETTRATLFLGAQGIRDQGKIHYTARVLSRLLHGQMRPEETKILASMAIPKEGHNKGEMKEHKIRSMWSPTLISVSGGSSDKRLDKLVDEYIKMNLMESSDSSPGGTPP